MELKAGKKWIQNNAIYPQTTIIRWRMSCFVREIYHP